MIFSKCELVTIGAIYGADHERLCDDGRGNVLKSICQ